MKRRYVHLFLLTWVVICLLAPSIAHARSGSNVDVALVMDSSGSMKRTDPGSLRIPAAKLFISLLGSNDRAAVLSFSDQGYPIASLTPVSSETNKKTLLDATDRITSKGLQTNLYAAFQKGMQVLLDAREDGREQIIVLMSDGMMDVGDQEETGKLLDQLKSELSNELKKNNIKVYAIAFTDQSDRKLLEKLSKQTGGFYNLAMTDKDFHLVFTSIFESLKSPEMLPMEKNGFLVDGSIQEVTIVVSKESAATDIRIQDPNGHQYTGNQQYSGISWFVSDNFDMITVQKPVEGRWQILYSTGINNKAYIITDLTLETNFERLYAVFGENLDVQAWLEKEGTIITDGEVLETTDVYIELNNPDGNISNLKPLNSGDGIFQKNIVPFKDGNYTLRVIAKGRTYEREKAFLFNVANLQESKEDLKAAREARKDTQTEAEKHSGGEEQAPVNWTNIIVQFITINLIIGILVVAYMKRERIKEIRLVGNVFRRPKDITPSPEETIAPEESMTRTERVSKEPEEQEVEGSEQITKKEAALEEVDSEGKETKQSTAEDDKDPENEKGAAEEAASEEDAPDEAGNDGGLNNLEEEIQRLEKLRQQEEETQAQESGKDTASETEELKVSEGGNKRASAESIQDEQAGNAEAKETDEQGTKPEEVKASPASPSEARAAVETDAEETPAEIKEEEDPVDDMWAEALNEQAAAESTEAIPETAKEEQITDAQESHADRQETAAPELDTLPAQDMEEDTSQASDKENVDDMWAAALDEQAGADESTAEVSMQNTEQAEKDTGKEDVDTEMDADQMWEEALSEQAEAEKPSESMNKPGRSSGASD